MIKRLVKLFTNLAFRQADAGIDGMPCQAVSGIPPTRIEFAGEEKFDIAENIVQQCGFPILRWDLFALWSSGLQDKDLQYAAWTIAKRAWLLHLREALQPSYRILETDNVILLSKFSPGETRSILQYMEKTIQRVIKTLEGIGRPPSLGKEILIAFDDSESYYRYVSNYYPDETEIAQSSGMHINEGCSHYVAIKDDVQVIESVIAHEFTHGCVKHLPLPLWLNEGLAVNTEERLTGRRDVEYGAAELRQMHLAFWGELEIQEFWSGKSFQRSDDGNLLSYELARILVEHLSRDWPRFRNFVLAADASDAGKAAAVIHLDLNLGDLVCAFLERESSVEWNPHPTSWGEAR